jgi:hypothetical protein
MTTPEPIAAAELGPAMLDHVRAALIRGGGDEHELLAQINRGELFLCWTDCWLGLRARIAGLQQSRLCDALRWQAEDYTRDGLHISARDCDWLAAKLTGGALQLVTAAHVSQAREAQAAQRRGHDLDHWQQQAAAGVLLA